MEIGESSLSYYFSNETIEIDYSSSVVSFSVSDDAISLAVFDELTHEALFFERFSLKENLTREISFPFTADDLSKIFISQNAGRFTIIPNGLKASSDEQLAGYLNCKEEDLIKSTIGSVNAQVVFKASQSFKWLCQMFPNAEVGHSVTCTVENAVLRNRYQKGIKMYIDVSESMSEIVIFSDNQFISGISESHQTKSDLLYQIMSRLESANFNQLEDIVYLSGLVEQTDQLYLDLAKYVKEIRLNSGFKFQKLHKELRVVPKYKFFNVINAYQCV